MHYLERILNALNGVRQTGPDTYSALCPAHQDKNPSLDIRYAGNKALVICRAGCTFGNIVQAMCLEPWEFFADAKPPRPIKGTTLNRRECKAMLEDESYLIKFAQATMQCGGELTAKDVERVLLANKRVRKLRGLLGL